MGAWFIVGASVALNIAIFYRIPWLAVAAGCLFALAIARAPT